MSTSSLHTNSQLVVLLEHAWQEPRLAENLEAVADPEHRPTRIRKTAHGAHRRRHAGDRPAAEVVAVREAAGKDDGTGLAGELGLVVPHEHGVAAHSGERPGRIVVVVRPGKLNDRDDRAWHQRRLGEGHVEALDERVRQEVAAHPLELCPGVLRPVGGELDVDDATDAHLAHVEPELAERAADRLSLRIEDPVLRPYEDRRPHRTTSGSAA